MSKTDTLYETIIVQKNGEPKGAIMKVLSGCNTFALKAEYRTILKKNVNVLSVKKEWSVKEEAMIFHDTGSTHEDKRIFVQTGKVEIDDE